MLNLLRARLATKYILFEIIPSFLLGVFVFVFILLMFQFLRLTEFVLTHGVTINTVLKMMGYMTISFLPVILPMSLILSILLTYGRMSNDSEVVAFKSLGLNTVQLGFPAMILAAFVTLLSLQTAFNIAPWGNRQFELIISKLKSEKASITIKAGVFSEGFFDLVVYSNEVESATGKLKKVFIYDERSGDNPYTIIAKEGQIIKDPENPNLRSMLRLKSGSIHRNNDESYTKIDFDSYDINLFTEAAKGNQKKSPLSYSSNEIEEVFSKPNNLNNKFKIKLLTEYHRRWSLGFVSIIFALVGLGLGIQANRRNAKTGGFVLAIVVIIAYWTLMIAFEGMSKTLHLPIWLAAWIPNLIFLAFGSWKLHKSYKV